MSRAFRFVLQAREKLYESGILDTLRLKYPVISVGNLTLGGTGKTPLVIALAEGLRDRGFHPVILSRGYGRTSRGVLVVGNNWEESGDEPLLMKQRLGNVPVVVGANRYQAGQLAEQKQLGNIFILDDGFQHRRLHRDVDIITIDPIEWAAGEMLLPTGRWREPKAAAARAHAICVQENRGQSGQGNKSGSDPNFLGVQKIRSDPDFPPRFTVRTEIQGIYKEDGPVTQESFKGRAIVAFAGIAKPERFFAAVESLGIHPIKCVRFRDHHHYSIREIERLGGEMLITTEKDAVRLSGIADRPYCYLRISAEIPEFEALISLILNRLPNL
jgi:tetraacyldisaccharide 4'-kinase